MSVGWIFMKTVSGWQRVNVGILAHQIWREYFDIMLSWSLEQNVLLVHHGRVVDSSPALLILHPYCWFFTRIVDSLPAVWIIRLHEHYGSHNVIWFCIFSTYDSGFLGLFSLDKSIYFRHFHRHLQGTLSTFDIDICRHLNRHLCTPLFIGHHQIMTGHAPFAARVLHCVWG